MAAFQRDNLQLEILRDISGDVAEADFVPYACLYNHDTLLTKNGELLQVIKVTGFTYEAIDMQEVDLRKIVRAAISKSIPSNHYAVWFHTLRRKRQLSPAGEFVDEFSRKLDDAWRGRNEWDRKFTNELYITLVREGQTADIKSVKGFFTGLVPNIDRRVRLGYLEKIGQELQNVTEHMLTALKDFGARRLTLVQRDGIYYGEHLEFLEKLINLEERVMPVSEVDLSEYLTDGEITFAYNAMEVRTQEGKRRFGAVLAVKEYKEASLYQLDEFLQLPCEFIVSQCVDFINAKRALAVYEEQKYYLQVSGDTELAEESELAQILRNNYGRDTDYGEQQTTVFVIGYSLRELEYSVKLLRSALAKLGIVTIREDLKMEESFWSQLPGNFEFVKRLNYTNSGHLGGFLNIQNYPAGNATGSHWGPPVTLFYTAAGTPYFFNFHVGENGHTTVIGPPRAGKSVLINFLIAQARKYRNRLFYLDARGSAGHFIRAIGGNYVELKAGVDLVLAPLSLPDSAPNREFLRLWLATLIDPTGERVDESTMSMLQQVIATIYQESGPMRLQRVAELLKEKSEAAATALAPWYGTGDYAYLFDHEKETARPHNGVIGFNLQPFMDDVRLKVPLASYLLHRTTMTLDGTPSMFVLDEAWQLLNNPLFAARIAAWMGYLIKRNALAIFATEDVDDTGRYEFSRDIVKHAATQIYLPDEDPSDVYDEIFGLTDEEFHYLDAMNVDYRHFLLKRGNETIVAELNLGGMDEVVSVLSGQDGDDQVIQKIQAKAI